MQYEFVPGLSVVELSSPVFYLNRIFGLREYAVEVGKRGNECYSTITRWVYQAAEVDKSTSKVRFLLLCMVRLSR